MKKAILLSAIFALTFSCKNNTDKKEAAKAEVVTNSESNSQSSKDMFKEGIIKVKIDASNNPMGIVLNKIDIEKGDYDNQLNTIMENLTPEEQTEMQKKSEKLQKQADSGNIKQAMNAAAQGLAMMFMPFIQNKIMVSGNKATAYSDAIAYHLENQVDLDSKTGTIFIQSQKNKDQNLTFTYDEDYFGEDSTLKTLIDEGNYERNKTASNENILGYNCNQFTYTLTGNTGDANISKVIVWTSPQMPKALNFMHQFYVNEEHGIMKIKVFYGESGDFMTYAFDKITEQKVTTNDLDIQKTKPIYDAKANKQKILMKTMEVMMSPKG